MNWFIPALVKSRVGSLCGTSEELRTTRWPRSSKYFRNVWRTRSPVHLVLGAVLFKDSLDGSKSLLQKRSALATTGRVAWDAALGCVWFAVGSSTFDVARLILET